MQLLEKELKNINRINNLYKIYKGDQGWEVAADLDYTPTQKITNHIKFLIDKKARFMFGNKPFLDLRTTEVYDIENKEVAEKHREQAQIKEDLLHDILWKDNHFHSKLLKAMKDCSIGGKVAIKLWAKEDVGIKVIFSPAQEFIAVYDEEDIHELLKVTFVYTLKDDMNKRDQRIKKQTWELIKGKCILNEGIYNGNGEAVEIIEENRDTKLDFIPVIIIQNGGLTGEIEGESDVEQLWQNQDQYNKLTSDDIDALKFQMFGQDVFTDADEDSMGNIVIAPGALMDLQTNISQSNAGRQAAVQRLESGFSYSEKYQDTVDRIKNDMYDTMDVPNVSLDTLKGLMTSGKAMRSLYWGLISVCEEQWVEWGSALELMVRYIFEMIDIYNLYENGREIARYNTSLNIEYTFPILEDTLEEKASDREEVFGEVLSRKSYINKWSEVENVDEELEQIRLEKEMLDMDNYSRASTEELEGVIDRFPIDETEAGE